MGLPRSTFYDAPTARLDDAEIVGRMPTICDEFEAYGYRLVGAELRHQGVVVNHKKIRRLMREHNLQPSCTTRRSPTALVTTACGGRRDRAHRSARADGRAQALLACGQPTTR
jgi:hypothetical protein